MCFRIFIFIILMDIFSLITTSSLGVDDMLSSGPSKQENTTSNNNYSSNYDHRLLNFTENAKKEKNVGRQNMQEEGEENRTDINVKSTKDLETFGTSKTENMKKNTIFVENANKNKSPFVVNLEFEQNTQPDKKIQTNKFYVSSDKCGSYVTHEDENNKLSHREERNKSGRNCSQILDNSNTGNPNDWNTGMYWDNKYYKRYWPLVDTDRSQVEGFGYQGVGNLQREVHNWPWIAETLPQQVTPQSIGNVPPEGHNWPYIVKTWPNVVDTWPQAVRPERVGNIHQQVHNWPNIMKTLTQAVRPERVGNVPPEGHNWPYIVKTWPNIVDTWPQAVRPERVGNIHQQVRNWPNIVETWPQAVRPERVGSVYQKVHYWPNTVETLPQGAWPENVGNLPQRVDERPHFNGVWGNGEQRISHNGGNLRLVGYKRYQFPIWLPLESASTYGLINGEKLETKTSQGWVRDADGTTPTRRGLGRSWRGWNNVGRWWLPEEQKDARIGIQKIRRTDSVENSHSGVRDGFGTNTEVSGGEVKRPSQPVICCLLLTGWCGCQEPNGYEPHSQQVIKGGGERFQINGREERPLQIERDERETRYAQVEECGSTRARLQQVPIATKDIRITE